MCHPAGSPASAGDAPYGVAASRNTARRRCWTPSGQSALPLHLGSKHRKRRSRRTCEIAGRSADLIVGADGVWSSVRTAIPGSPAAAIFRQYRLALHHSRERGAGLFSSRMPSPHSSVPPRILSAYPLKETDSFQHRGDPTGGNTGDTLECARRAHAQKACCSAFAAGIRRIAETAGSDPTADLLAALSGDAGQLAQRPRSRADRRCRPRDDALCGPGRGDGDRGCL